MFAVIIQDILMTLGSLLLFFLLILIFQVFLILFKIHTIVNDVKKITKKVDLGTFSVISSIIKAVTNRKAKD